MDATFGKDFLIRKNIVTTLESAVGKGGFTANELAHLLRTEKASVNRCLYALEREDIVCRKPFKQNPPVWICKDDKKSSPKKEMRVVIVTDPVYFEQLSTDEKYRGSKFLAVLDTEVKMPENLEVQILYCSTELLATRLAIECGVYLSESRSTNRQLKLEIGCSDAQWLVIEHAILESERAFVFRHLSHTAAEVERINFT